MLVNGGIEFSVVHHRGDQARGRAKVFRIRLLHVSVSLHEPVGRRQTVPRVLEARVRFALLIDVYLAADRGGEGILHVEGKEDLFDQKFSKRLAGG